MSKKIEFIILVILSLTLILIIVVWLPPLSYLLGARVIIRPAPGTTMTVPTTGYAPSPYQTDATPCLTAAGTPVRPGTVAANFLPLGTLLQIDDEVFIVEDRAHPRYYQTVDIFFSSTSDALEFGKRHKEITILGYGQPGQTLPTRETPGPETSEQTTTEAAGTPEYVTFFDKLQGQLYYLRHLIKTGLPAGMEGLPADVNRYDVDCSTE